MFISAPSDRVQHIFDYYIFLIIKFSISTKNQSCKNAVSWYLGYQTFLTENLDIFKYQFKIYHIFLKNAIPQLYFTSIQLLMNVSEKLKSSYLLFGFIIMAKSTEYFGHFSVENQDKGQN